MYSGQIYVPLVCNEIDLLIPLMYGWQLIGNVFIWEKADRLEEKTGSEKEDVSADSLGRVQ